MILTTRWMVVLPRRWGAINKEAGVNSLGMLGVIAVATTKESLAQPGVAKGIKLAMC
jgi:ATP adenylyltransferase